MSGQIIRESVCDRLLMVEGETGNEDSGSTKALYRINLFIAEKYPISILREPLVLQFRWHFLLKFNSGFGLVRNQKKTFAHKIYQYAQAFLPTWTATARAVT